MNLNTQQLQYLLEIENTQSISQAAANLFMAQPNLSRILKETEKELGFMIFERSRNGVYPTELGKIFLQRAKSILKDASFIEQLASPSKKITSLHACVPRSFYYMDLLCRYLNDPDHGLHRDFTLLETDPITSFERLESGQSDLAIIRYLPGYRNYFLNRAGEHGFTFLPLPDTQFHPVYVGNPEKTDSQKVDLDALRSRVCISFSSEKTPSQSMSLRSRLQVSDRLAQLQLLTQIPNSYCWAEPLPEDLLKHLGLIQLPCNAAPMVYQNALCYRDREYHDDDFQNIIHDIIQYCSASSPKL